MIAPSEVVTSVAPAARRSAAEAAPSAIPMYGTPRRAAAGGGAGHAADHQAVGDAADGLEDGVLAHLGPGPDVHGHVPENPLDRVLRPAGHDDDPPPGAGEGPDRLAGVGAGEGAVVVDEDGADGGEEGAEGGGRGGG